MSEQFAEQADVVVDNDTSALDAEPSVILDEDRLGGWQSGLLWRDRTKKPSYGAFKALVAEVRAKNIDCSKVRGTPDS